MQKFIEGKTYAYNEAPDFLLEKAPELLAEIHEGLRDFEELPEGIGESFFKNRRPEQMAQSFHNSLQIAIANGDDDNAKDIRNILEIIGRFPDYHFDVSKFTFLAVCDFFGQYYQSMTRNRSIYLEQAQLSAKMLRWFDKHIEELNIRLKKLAETM